MKIEIDDKKLDETYRYWAEKDLVYETVMEETAELTQALRKMRRKPFSVDAKEAVFKEIRDVYISLGMLMKELRFDEETMEFWIVKKLDQKK